MKRYVFCCGAAQYTSQPEEIMSSSLTTEQLSVLGSDFAEHQWVIVSPRHEQQVRRFLTMLGYSFITSQSPSGVRFDAETRVRA